jgi:alginate O-acetyltransferase complex protein AlgI
MLIGYFWLLHKRLAIGSKLWLVGGSLFFYSWWNIYYLPLLLFSIFVNFFVGSSFQTDLKLKITKKQLLIFGILFNIGFLAFFKYTDFFLENFNGIFEQNIPLLHIVLPLGISFFTFTQIAFLVDAYKSKVKEYDLLNYILFVSYFPHLLAGPILHHAEMMPQFASRWNLALRWRNMSVGIFLFSIGLFKKVVIADTFAQFANVGFDTATTLNLIEAWATSLSYTLQLYFDFSGYTDMAIGMSLMFNIILPTNFNSPYKAKNIQEFWRRWHITLSRFLRDYIYIPLGGKKVSKTRNYLNLFAVFLIGGVWHGAGWTFIAWGVLHGIAIVLHRVWQDFGLRMWGWLGWILTFNFINITWVFFRSDNFETVKMILSGMIGFNEIVLPEKLAQKLAFLNTYGVEFTESYLSNSGLSGIKDLILIPLLIIFVLIAKNTQELSKSITYKPLVAVTLGLITVCGLIYLNRPSQFLYFQF